MIPPLHFCYTSPLPALSLSLSLSQTRTLFSPFLSHPQALFSTNILYCVDCTVDIILCAASLYKLCIFFPKKSSDFQAPFIQE